MAFGRIREESQTQNAEINMVPLIDVMLVLLVIFIITAPMVTQSVKLSLPKASALSNSEQIKQKPTMIAVNEKNEFYINNKLVSIESLSTKLSELKSESGDNMPMIQLHIDASVPYENVAQLLTELSKAGLPNIGFVSLPKEKN